MQAKKADFYKYMDLPLRKALTSQVNDGTINPDPDDYGNWTGGRPGKGKLIGTYRDISAVALSDYLGREATVEDLRALTHDDAVKIIKSWWDKMQLSEVPDQDVASITFHIKMHYGNLRLVQIALNKLGENLKVDGVFGPQSLAALIRQTKRDEVATYTAIRNTLKKSYEQANPKWRNGFMRFLKEDFPEKQQKKSGGC